MIRQEFINKYRYEIVEATLGSNLLPSVMMAQAMLESGTGESVLSRKYNNLFGIKAGSSWSGSVIELPTSEYVNGQFVREYARFRAYNFSYHSIKDRVKFLKKRFPGVLVQSTPKAQADALQKGGYATDPDYSNKLVKLINDNNLTELDKRKIKMKNIQIAIAVLIMLTAALKMYSILK